MYTIQPDYDGMLADYLDEISAADYEESRQEAEALRLEKEYRSEIIREWAEVAMIDGEENYDLNDQATWESWITPTCQRCHATVKPPVITTTPAKPPERHLF